jgi:hypothetical protein
LTLHEISGANTTFCDIDESLRTDVVSEAPRPTGPYGRNSVPMIPNSKDAAITHRQESDILAMPYSEQLLSHGITDPSTSLCRSPLSTISFMLVDELI